MGSLPAIYRSLEALPGRKPRKSLKKIFPDLLARNLKKSGKVVKSPKSLQKVSFWAFFDFFRDFFEAQARRSGKTFLGIFSPTWFRCCLSQSIAKRARGVGEEGGRVGREWLWLEGRVLQLPRGGGPPNGSWGQNLVSRGRCGCGDLRPWSLRASYDFEANRPAKRKILRFLQRNGCKPACGHRCHCDFATRFLCR